ncbi:MAG TPA: uroporphyrinogen-III C-methyltransferase [Caldilineaceae bacterium]|nr:uroporphyrinogen-III C-methyltransferase [Caldilineaceae bacterium]
MTPIRWETLRRGKAYLVGAGPGRADLITVRGLALLRRADVVVYDRLIARELLDEIRPGAERIFVGKESGRHTLSQTAINELLVARVRLGKQVVRLKGGDPFVFGRGGEEAQALAEAGLPFEIVPGVSSAVAAPAFAGIPLTHRGISSAFAVVTGHELDGKRAPGADWEALARVPTLVILMGVERVEQIAARLIAAGRAASTPAAAVSAGTTDQQQVVSAPLAELPAALAAAHLPAPAVIVVGEVAALQDQLAWFMPTGDAAGFVPIEDQTPARLAVPA